MLTIENVQDLPDHRDADLGHTEWLTVEQDRVDAFAEATEDRQWIHVDPERAKDSPFGGPIAHGFLSLSMLSYFLDQLICVEHDGMLVNYGLERVRFPSPVPVGSRIRAGGKLAEVQAVPAGYQLTLDIAVEVQGAQKPACVARWLVRVM